MEKKQKIPIKLGLVDRFLAVLSPERAQKRMMDRVKYNNSVHFLSNQGYITKDSTRRSMRGWGATANSADIDILPKSDSLRASCRDLDMNSGIAAGIVDRFSTNALGLGLRLKPQIDREILGFKGEDGKKRAKKWENSVQREWNAYSESIFSDAELTLNVNENAALAFVNVLLSGDVFIALPGIPYKGVPYDLRVKIIEADYVSNPNGLMETTRIAGGVETNHLGAPIAYHFRKPDPNATVNLGIISYNNWERIQRFNDVSLQQILHLFIKKRPGQKRGVPLLAPVIEDVKQITRYKGAEVDAAILNSFFTVFIKSINNAAGPQLAEGYIPPPLGIPADTEPTPGVSVKNESDPRDAFNYEMGRANILELDEQQDISLADPKHPIAGFNTFLEAICQEIGAGVGLPYESLMLRFNSSFSASKAALQEASKAFLKYRKFMVDHYYRPIYETWMYEGISKGRIKAPGFFNDFVLRKAWLGSAWIGSGQGMIDPLKETNAAVKRIDSRISTHEKEYQKYETGDWFSDMNNFKKEIDHLDDLNINPIKIENKNDGNSQNIIAPNQNLPAKPINKEDGGI